MRVSAFVVILCAFSLSACQKPAAAPPQASPGPAKPAVEATSPDMSGAAAADAAAPAEAVAPAAPALEPELAMDLAHNRYRWHVYDQGLVIPFVQEGFWKYTQEYRRPFEQVVTHEGMEGRVLTQSEATLRVPWSGGVDKPVTARFVVHGMAKGQSLRLDINGKRAGTVKVEPSWQVVTLTIPAGVLVDGENEFLLRANQRGPVDGVRSWGLYHALELIPGELAADAGAKAKPTAQVMQQVSLGQAQRLALGEFKRHSMWLEVPKQAWLTFELGAQGQGARALIEATLADGRRVELWSGPAPQGSFSQQRAALEGIGGQLVKLSITLEGGARLAAARIVPQAAPRRQAPAQIKNVILIVVDALRADRLSLYGQTHVQTPQMTLAGAHAIVYLHNQASAPSSPPSHGSIQTGMIPRVHGVTGDKGKLNVGTPLLSSQLEDAGVATAYVGNNPFGMSRLKEAGRWSAYIEPNRQGMGIDCSAVVKETLRFAREQHEANKRFFVSALPFEPHTPYRYHDGISDKYHDTGWGPPVGKSVDGYLLGSITGGKKLTEDQWSQLRALYDGEVEHMDGCFGELVAGLKQLKVWEQTAIVLTADHGEGMFEHGRMGHAYGHYAELSNVPFVVFLPGHIKDGPWRVEAVTSNIDITPTILALAGVKPAEQVQGAEVTTIALREPGWTPRVVSMEYGKSYALRARDWKLMVGYDGKEQLYHVSVDPTEQQDVLGSEPFGLRYMRDMTGFFLQHRSQWKMSSWGSWGDHGAGYIAHVEGK